jgi:hypothetical protein
MTDDGIRGIKNPVFLIFLAGIGLYFLGFSFFNKSQVSYYFSQGIQVIGFLIFVPAALYFLQWRFHSNFEKFAFILYFFWSLLVVFRGIEVAYEPIKVMLVDSNFGVFAYFAPLAFLFPKEIKYWNWIFRFIILLGLFFVLYNILFFRETSLGVQGYRVATGNVETFSHYLAVPLGFILLTQKYHSKRINVIALVLVLLIFFIAAIRGRRGLMFISLTILAISYFVFLMSSKGYLIRMALGICVLVLVLFFTREVFLTSRDGLFRLTTERLYEKTRSGVEKDFYRDMNQFDWVWGKGFDGEYYCPGIDAGDGKFSTYRGVIETGYLQFILKGGVINLFLFLLIMIPAGIKGIFFSNNWLSRAAGIWIILFIGFSYPIVINSFNMNYLLMWLSAGVCYQPDIRNLPDQEILQLLKADET